MKVLFICGSLEPGKDGVGDYTRKLSGALIGMGMQAAIVSINDPYVVTATAENQVGEESSISVLRLPAADSWKSKHGITKQFIENEVPDWISLQFVPYSFQKKGLPFGLAGWLKSVGENRNWHIMFHELWLGIKEDAPLKHYVYGFIQKQLIKQLYYLLSPKVVDTSNRIYQLELQSVNIKANILLLFSNIGYCEPDSDLSNTLYKNLGISTESEALYHKVGCFGSLDSKIGLRQILTEETEHAIKKQKRLAYITFGKSANSVELNLLMEELKEQVVFCNLGQLAEQGVSTVLQLLDVGICSTPKEYIGKSGVYAAMKRHDLPVIIRSGMTLPKYEQEIELFNRYLESRSAYKWDVKHVATKFYENISMYSNL